jgi:integrase
MRKPYFKKSRQAWYANHPDGRRIKLGATENEAWEAWRKLDLEVKSEESPVEKPSQDTLQSSSESAAPEGADMTIATLIDTYLEWIGRDGEENRSKATHISYTRALRPLKELFGETSAGKLLPKDLDEVVRERLTTYKLKSGVVKRYSSTTRWHFYKAAMAAFNWAKNEGHIATHRLVKIKNKQRCKVRQDWIDQEQFDRLIAACEEPLLRDLLTVLWDTGARPFEILQAESKHIDHQSRCLRYFKSKGDKVKAKRDKDDATRTVRL